MHSYYIGDMFVGMVMTPPHTYYLGDDSIGVNYEMIDWCNNNLPEDAYMIIRNTSTTVNTVFVNFKDTEAEALFVMRWIR